MGVVVSSRGREGFLLSRKGGSLWDGGGGGRREEKTWVYRGCDVSRDNYAAKVTPPSIFSRAFACRRGVHPRADRGRRLDEVGGGGRGDGAGGIISIAVPFHVRAMEMDVGMDRDKGGGARGAGRGGGHN